MRARAADRASALAVLLAGVASLAAGGPASAPGADGPASRPASKADPRALATSRMHVLRTRPRVAPGIETAMPRDSLYGQAVALDVQERFEESAKLYRDAEAEFRRQARRTSTPRAPLHTAWQRKSRSQYLWSRQLALRAQGLQPLGGAASTEMGYAYMMKFLAARAFTGRAPAALARRARERFEEALRREPDNILARLLLATLLHEIGEPLRARTELEHLLPAMTPRQRADPLLTLRLAAYYAAAGEREQALAEAERAARSPRFHGILRDLLRWSNEFDRLREEPRFRRLLDEPEPRRRSFP